MGLGVDHDVLCKTVWDQESLGSAKCLALEDRCNLGGSRSKDPIAMINGNGRAESSRETRSVRDVTLCKLRKIERAGGVAAGKAQLGEFAVKAFGKGHG